MSINRSKGVALYYQLENILIDLITNGDLKENDKLPSERELCDTYNVSRTTARQAVGELENKGYLYKVHGKGTFVSPKVYKQQLLKFYSFTEEMKKLDKTPTSKIIDFKIIESKESVAQKLNLEQGRYVYRILRVRLADNEPMMVETTFLPVTRFEGLTEVMLKERPMYEIFKDIYNVSITKATESFRPTVTNKKEAEMLEIREDIPSMKIERLTYENNRPIEYTVSIARGDKFVYTVNLE